MTDLLDVNLLVSLAWPNHVHHKQALTWFRSRRGQPWATTPFTEAGFVRISSNASAIPAALTPPQAVAVLERIRQARGHEFLDDDVPLVVDTYLTPAQIASYKQVTDAHLLALSRRHGARLATFDRGVGALAGGRDILLVPIV